MNWQAVTFMILIANQAMAGGMFLAIYLAHSRWADSPTGRHLAYWVAAGVAVDLSWLLLLLVQASWLIYVLLAAQAAFGVLAWQRVALVWRAQRG